METFGTIYFRRTGIGKENHGRSRGTQKESRRKISHGKENPQG